MLVNIVALLINIPLNYAFIYGKWGAPEMGAAGCGVATAIVMWIQLLGVIVVVQKLPQLRVVDMFKNWQSPRWSVISSQINLGLPVGLSTMAEVGLFSGVALILAQLGADVVAGVLAWALTVMDISSRTTFKFWISYNRCNFNSSDKF